MLESETQKRARRRANEMGVSFAEYIRRVVERDLAGPEKKRIDVSQIFNLGSSGNSDIAKRKRAMIGEAFAASRGTRRRRP